jgi:hypothetical protein
MTTEVKTAFALKEWGAIIDAMERGHQIVSLRKGGIREKSFLVADRSFYLLPTFEHQASNLIKPEFRSSIEKALASQRDERGLIVRLRADVAGLWEIDDDAQLSALDGHQIFTRDYAETRFKWRPRQPLTVLLLRAYRLARPWSTGLPSGVGGCRSWIEIDVAGAPPVEDAVVTDKNFATRLERLRDVLGPERNFE